MQSESARRYEIDVTLRDFSGGVRVINSPPALEDVAYLCRLPRLFRGGTDSAHKLVHKSRTRPEVITVDDIKAVLSTDPQLIDEWQRWSEDKRTSSGWYLESQDGSHVVGSLSRGDRLEFPDAASACAEFILRELRVIW